MYTQYSETAVVSHIKINNNIDHILHILQHVIVAKNRTTNIKTSQKTIFV